MVQKINNNDRGLEGTFTLVQENFEIWASRMHQNELFLLRKILKSRPRRNILTRSTVYVGMVYECKFHPKIFQLPP